jgi:hypothetical protein
VGLVHSFLKRNQRYQIGEDKRNRWIVELHNALKHAVEAEDWELVVKITECLRRFDAMNQADEHLAIKLATEQAAPAREIVVTYKATKGSEE